MFKTALVIEDDLQMAQLISKALSSLGYAIHHCTNGADGVAAASGDAEYAFVVLDLMLPGMHGMDVCKALRDKSKRLPIIVLTAISEEMTTALLLELGADDYINKPYREAEFKARIRTVLRRYTQTAADTRDESMLKIGDLEIDATRRKVAINEAPVEFTAREFDIVHFLASHRGKPFTREQLNAAVYGHEVHGYERSITSQINRIRAKLEKDPANPRYLLTLRGVGYLFAENA